MNFDDQMLWREKLQEFQKENEIPWWKFSYAESLLQKSFDYFEVGQLQLGEKVLERLQTWLEQQKNFTPSAAEKSKSSSPFDTLWSSEHFDAELNSIQGKLQAYQSLIPRVELEDFKHLLNELRQRNESAELEMSQIRELRIKLIIRVHQSLNSVDGIKELNQKAYEDIQVEGIGPYNNRFNFGEAFKLLSASDPIWAGDFLELYNGLFGLEDKITSKVMKR